MCGDSVTSLVAKSLDVRAFDVKAFEGFFTHGKMGCLFPFSSWYQRNVVYGFHNMAASIVDGVSERVQLR